MNEFQDPPFGIGTKFYGYCNGFFHADYYHGSKTVVSFGDDWIVAIEEDNYPNFANFFPGNWKGHIDFILSWKEKPTGEYAE